MTAALGQPTSSGAINTLFGNSTQSPNYGSTGGTQDGSTSGQTGTLGGGDLPTILGKVQAAVLVGTVTPSEAAAIQAAASTLVARGAKQDSPTLGLDALNLAYANGYISDTAYLVSAPVGSPLPKSTDSILYSDWVVLSTAIAAISTVATNAINASAQTALASQTFTLPSGDTAQVCVEYRLSRAAAGTSAVAAPAASGAIVQFAIDWSKTSEAAVSNNQYVLTVAGVAYQIAAAAVAAIAAGAFEYRYVVRFSRSSNTGNNRGFVFDNRG